MPENPMRDIFPERLVINIGTGSEDRVQTNAKRLLELITKRKPADARSKIRNPSFKISKGQKIGAFVTIRGKEIAPLAKKLFDAIDNKVKSGAIINNSVSFGIHEYIDISGIKYDPKVGMLGMNVNITFRRKGMRVAARKRRRGEISERHRIVPPEEIAGYLKKQFDVEVM
jgi:large subunit ribosomal protein L5